MVLNRPIHLAMLALALASVSACKQSLFDNNPGTDGGGGGGDGGDGSVPSTCPAPCLADAGADFDGSPTGSTGRWRYLDDHRDRTWAAMTATTSTFVGADPANTITSCASNPGAAACTALPGALLVSSAGATSAADPAIEFTAEANQVIQLALRVSAPTTQVIRVYRNSREDVLYTGTAMAGMLLETAISVDALAGDRFLVAIAPTALGATDVGMQLFVSATGEVFPSTCQVALTFAAAMGNTIANPCGSVTFTNNNETAATPPVLTAGPFAELGMATDVLPLTHYEGSAPLPRQGDSTVQLWARHDAVYMSYGGWLFSDYDLDVGGGLGMVIYDAGGLKLDVCVVTDATMNPAAVECATMPWPTDLGWHHVRASHTGGTVSVCIDGTKQGSFPAAMGTLQSTRPPYLGQNVVWSPQIAAYDGKLDDVRVFSTALPCE